MKELPDYKEEIKRDLTELNSSVKQGKGRIIEDLRKQIPGITSQAEKILNSGSPRIMLFGTYNAGKSTLLNALAGTDKARVADIPATDRVDEYEWRGYTLVDTPGINAPIEHEKTSLQSIKECQVIIFVISSDGSFEDAKIYEAMKNVVDMDKRLFIVLNDKAGYGIKSEAIANIKDAIQKNLINSGVPREKAAGFSFSIVNAYDAYEGRRDKDEELIESSGILELEQRILEEIRRVNGYAIAADACKYVIDSVKPICAGFSREGGKSGMLDEFLAMRTKYGEFMTNFANRLDSECAGMPTALRNCFGSPGSAPDESQIKTCLEQVYAKFSDTIQSQFITDCKYFLAILSRGAGKLLKFEADGKGEMAASIDSARIREIQDIFKKAEEIQPNMPPAEVEESKSDIDLMPLILQLPKRLPIPLPIPPAMIYEIAKIIYNAIFGKSDAERRNERVEAEARAKREAEERQAREKERYRQELNQYCQDTAAQFRMDIRRLLNEKADRLFEPLFGMIEEEYIRAEKDQEQAVETLNRIGAIIARLEILRGELLMPGINLAKG